MTTLNERAQKIVLKIQKKGCLQVRFYRGMFLTYPYPCKRGYGTRGELVGVYQVNAQIEWVIEDILDYLVKNHCI